MNGFVHMRNGLRLVLPLLLCLGWVAPAQAADERISTLWINAATTETYEVTTPVGIPLLDVKLQVMSDMGLPPLHSPYYGVEKRVVTTTAIRGQYDPVTGLPLVVTTEEYVPQDEALTLSELGTVAGDTMRLRQVEEVPAPTPDTTASSDDDLDPAKCHRKDGHRHHGGHAGHHKAHGLAHAKQNSDCAKLHKGHSMAQAHKYHRRHSMAQAHKHHRRHRAD